MEGRSTHEKAGGSQDSIAFPRTPLSDVERRGRRHDGLCIDAECFPTARANGFGKAEVQQQD